MQSNQEWLDKILLSEREELSQIHVVAELFCQDMFSEALLCFGASSTSMDEDDDEDNDAEVTTFFCFSFVLKCHLIPT